MGARHRWDARHLHRPSLTDSAILGWDDPVPSEADYSRQDSSTDLSHNLEWEVQRRLMNEPGLHFSSLVVRRLEDGVCIQGVLETEDTPDLAGLARQVQGVKRVIDQVVIRNSDDADIGCC